jgi:hypothetical protein
MSQSVENTNSTLQAQRIPCEFNIPSPLYVTELHGNMHRISIRNSKTKYDEKFSPILMQDMIGKSKDRRKKNMHSRLPKNNTIACKNKATPGQLFFFLPVFVRVWLHHHRLEASSCCGWPGSGYGPLWGARNGLEIQRFASIAMRLGGCFFFFSSSKGFISPYLIQTRLIH